MADQLDTADRMAPLERAARALEEALPDVTDIAQGWFYPDDLRAGVRAVLTAIREPSEGMVDAARTESHAAGTSIRQHEIEGIFRAMIDAALTEEQSDPPS